MLTVSNLSKTFGPTRALVDVNLVVRPGEMVALIGASGSGKSTLLRHIAGLAAGDRGSGRVAVGPKAVQCCGKVAADVRRIRTGVGLVFQQFNLVGRLNVRTNVLLGALGRTPWWRSMSMSFKRDDRELAVAALAKVGLAATADQRASTLSGGQQQRAAIARALVQKAGLLLADEPVASLDPESSVMVMELLRKLNLEEGLTVLVSLHQIEHALRYCPRAVALRQGRVCFDGPSAELTADKMRSIYGESAAETFGRSQAAATERNAAAAELPSSRGAQDRPEAQKPSRRSASLEAWNAGWPV
ncbi:MAG: phosphonate ABC transporter ATP-binding protein [Deltaproteobacteria bacterium]|jgi:phosphonate transport system ATP-binding protein|nr:phosphonate ABC transporter ATP-binding protein [Deltaproteobacteria bacterium]